MNERDDETLLRRYAKENDEAAFRELARRYGPLVYAACLRDVRRPDLAEDAAQAVFLDLAQKAGRVNVQTTLVPWLYSAARFAARNVLRTERRRPTVPLDEMVPAPAATSDESLFQALDALNDAEREAVVLRFVQGLSLAEVGRAQGVSEDAARMRIQRALGRLRTEYVPALTLPLSLSERLATLAPPKPSPLMSTPFLLAAIGTLVVTGAAATTLSRPTTPSAKPTPSPVKATALPRKPIAAIQNIATSSTKSGFPALTKPFTLRYHFVERDLRPKAMRDEEAAINRRQMLPQVDAGQMTPEDMESSLAGIRQLHPPFERDITVSYDGSTLYLECQGGGEPMMFLVRGTTYYRFPQSAPGRLPGVYESYYLYVMPVPIVGASLPYLPFVQGGKILGADGAPMADGKPIYIPGRFEAKGGKVTRILVQLPGQKRPAMVTTLTDHRQVGGAMVAGRVEYRVQAQDGRVVKTREFRLVSASDRPLPADQFVVENHLPESSEIFVDHARHGSSFTYERSKGTLESQVAAFIARGAR